MDQEHEVYVNLEEKDGEYRIDTNVYEFLDDFKNGIINSDILGKALEPEERFENPYGMILFSKGIIWVIIVGL